MGTWYTEDHLWNADYYTKELDEGFVETYCQPGAMMDVALGLKPESRVIAGRVHGNPFIESCVIGRQESPARMRDQLAVYEAAFAVEKDRQVYKDTFMNTVEAYAVTDGGHIIDIDDPMLVEEGAAHVHKQFTDYLADVTRRDDDLGNMLRQYMDATFMNNLENGGLPGAVLVEAIRQRFGLPYEEWQGAEVEE